MAAMWAIRTVTWCGKNLMRWISAPPPDRVSGGEEGAGLTFSMQALSLTPRFSGVSKPALTVNRLSGFSPSVETAEAVQALLRRQITPLKRGVNDSGIRKSVMLDIDARAVRVLLIGIW